MSSSKRPPTESSSSDEIETLRRSPKRRLATVYDAVAGRVSKDGFMPTNRYIRVKTKIGQHPLRPDEVLFKQRNAPTRYEETDYYFAHTRLPPNQTLPSSDLLSALHAYISKFYTRSQETPNPKVYKSMDETALIALGILIEETAREVLGPTGDLAFVEAGEQSEDSSLYDGQGNDEKEHEDGRKEERLEDDNDILDQTYSSSSYTSESSEE